jgi:hypothetical protein
MSIKRPSGNKTTEPASDEPLILTPIPALGVLLLHLEKQKGSPLSEAEVLQARDKAVCVALPLSKRRAVDEQRGYQDIDPENVWEEWLAFKAQLNETAT